MGQPAPEASDDQALKHQQAERTEKSVGAPIQADRTKLLEPFFEQEPKTSFRPSNELGAKTDSPFGDFKPHEQVSLVFGDREALSQQVQGMSLNQARATIPAIRDELRQRGYSPGTRLLGFGTERDNPNSPFVDPDSLYKPGQELFDFVRAREDASKFSESLTFSNIFQTREQIARGNANPFNSMLNSDRNRQSADQMAARADAIKMGLSLPTDEQQSQYERRLSIEQATRRDPDLRDPFTLQIRVKPQMTLQQEQNYKEQLEMVEMLRTGDAVAHRAQQLQQEYDRNHWREDSHWFGLDNNKFLAEIKERQAINPGAVSDYDKFRTLATIDAVRRQNPQIFSEEFDKVDTANLTKEQLDQRSVHQKLRTDLGKQEHDTRRQLADRMRLEVTKLEVALGNQEVSRGLVSSGADAVIGQVGTPGGWGDMFMDSDATSRTTRENIEKARQASQELSDLGEFKGSNTEFAVAYQQRTLALSRSLMAVNDNLQKMADAHKGRIEGVSDLVQITAATATILSCAATAPETFGGSLAAIPVLAPMAAGAAGKITTKLLESETAPTASYRLPDMLTDGGVAAISSAPFMPGNRIALPLLRAETSAATQAVKAEGSQLALKITGQSLMQRTVQAGRTLARGVSELTPAAVYQSTVRTALNTSRRTLGYAAAGAIDGTLTSSSQALVRGDDVLASAAQGFMGGSIMGPLMGPAMKFAGEQLPKLGRALKDAANRSGPGLNGSVESPLPNGLPDTVRVDSPHAAVNGPHINKPAGTSPIVHTANGSDISPSTSSTHPPEVMLIPRPSGNRIHDMTPNENGPGANQGVPPESTATPNQNEGQAPKVEAESQPIEQEPMPAREENTGGPGRDRERSALPASGDRDQNVAQRKLTRALQETRGESGKTLAEEGWEIRASQKDSPADHAHIDIALVNEKKGIYLIVDTTSNNVIDASKASAIDKLTIGRANKGQKVVYTELHANGIARMEDILNSPSATLSRLVESGVPVSLRQHPLPPMQTMPIDQTRTAVRRYQDSLAGSSDPRIREFGQDLNRTVHALGKMSAHEVAAGRTAVAVDNFIASGAQQTAASNLNAAAEGVLRDIVRGQLRRRVNEAVEKATGKRSPAAGAAAPSAGTANPAHTITNTSGNNFRLTTSNGLNIDTSIDQNSVNKILNEEWNKAIRGVDKSAEYVLPRIQRDALAEARATLANPETMKTVARTLEAQKPRQLLGSDFNDPLAPGATDKVDRVRQAAAAAQARYETLNPQAGRSNAPPASVPATSPPARLVSQEVPSPEPVRATTPQQARPNPVETPKPYTSAANPSSNAGANSTSSPSTTNSGRTAGPQRSRNTNAVENAERPGGNDTRARRPAAADQVNPVKEAQNKALVAVADELKRLKIEPGQEGQINQDIRKAIHTLITQDGHRFAPPVLFELKNLYKMYSSAMPDGVIQSIHESVRGASR